MATFTLELRQVLGILYGDGKTDPAYYQPERGEIEYKGTKYGSLPIFDDYKPVGLGTYPVFDDTYRGILNGKIIDEFFVREIGVETIDLFILNIRKRMDQIMPYYNQLYLSQEIPYEALDTMSIHSVSTGNVTSEDTTVANGETNSDTTSGARAVNSTTPQMMLAGNKDYASSATDTNSSGHVEGTSQNTAESNSTTSNDSDNLVTGYQGVASSLIMRYRESLINIDTMILRDLEDCFMLVWNNGDAYTRNFYGRIL